MSPVDLRFIIIALVFSMEGLAQTPGPVAFPVTKDGPVQVKYATNLSSASTDDSFFHLMNAVAARKVLIPCEDCEMDSVSGPPTSICVSVYTFAPDEQLVSCCACEISENVGHTLSARNDLIGSVLTGQPPDSIVVKLIVQDLQGAACTASAGPAIPSNLLNGLVAWGTTSHKTSTPGKFAVTESSFVPATYSSSDHARIAAVCGFIQSNGGRFGVCNSCKPGAQGAARK